MRFPMSTEKSMGLGARAATVQSRGGVGGRKGRRGICLKAPGTLPRRRIRAATQEVGSPRPWLRRLQVGFLSLSWDLHHPLPPHPSARGQLTEPFLEAHPHTHCSKVGVHESGAPRIGQGRVSGTTLSSSLCVTPTLALRLHPSPYLTPGFKGPHSSKRVPRPERSQKPGYIVG